MTLVFFSLFINSIFSLFSGLCIVGFFIWFFRVSTGPWKLFLLSLPFFKIVFDCIYSASVNSILLAGLDVFSLPQGYERMLFLGGALRYYILPEFTFSFLVGSIDQEEFVASVGDFLATWLSRELSLTFLFILLMGITIISLGLLSIRLWATMKFESRRRRDHQQAKTIRHEKLRYRTVDIYTSGFFTGTPFTGGIFRPYICIPKDSLEKLNSCELEAVLKHELGHVRQFDLVVTLVIQILGDLFWFIPGYRWLNRRVDRLREIVADQVAVRNGANPELLASALIALKETSDMNKPAVLYSTFFREKSLLQLRIQNLLGKNCEKCSRFGWQYKWVRCVFSVWILLVVMWSTIGGYT